MYQEYNSYWLSYLWQIVRLTVATARSLEAIDFQVTFVNIEVSILYFRRLENLLRLAVDKQVQAGIELIDFECGC